MSIPHAKYWHEHFYNIEVCPRNNGNNCMTMINRDIRLPHCDGGRLVLVEDEENNEPRVSIMHFNDKTYAYETHMTQMRTPHTDEAKFFCMYPGHIRNATLEEVEDTYEKHVHTVNSEDTPYYCPHDMTGLAGYCFRLHKEHGWPTDQCELTFNRDCVLRVRQESDDELVRKLDVKVTINDDNGVLQHAANKKPTPPSGE